MNNGHRLANVELNCALYVRSSGCVLSPTAEPPVSPHRTGCAKPSVCVGALRSWRQFHLPDNSRVCVSSMSVLLLLLARLPTDTGGRRLAVLCLSACVCVCLPIAMRCRKRLRKSKTIRPHAKSSAKHTYTQSLARSVFFRSGWFYRNAPILREYELNFDVTCVLLNVG